MLWIWKGDDTFEKVKLSLSHKVEAIEWTPQSECFVAASADRVTFISSDLAPTTLTIPGSKGKKKTLRKLLMLPRTSKSIQAIVLIYSNGTAMHLGFSDWDGAAKLESHKELTVPKGVLHQGEEIVDGHLNGTKSIHLQTSTNRLLASSISLIGSSASSCAVSYHLAASEKPSTPSALAAIPSATGTLLLAADEKPSFILFQPTYPSVLAAREIPFTGSQVHSIVRLSESMVGLVTSSSKDATGTGRSMVHTLEFTLPSQGVGIAQMLESASLTRAYLRLSEVSPAASSHSLTKESDKEVEAVQARDAAFFASLESALKEGLAKAAEDVFAKWQTEEKAAIASHASQPKSKTMQAIQGRSKTAFASKAVNMILSQAIHGTSTPPKTTEDVQESTQSQAELYEGPATRTPRGAYPKSILTALLEMGWVSDRMWKESGGVITGGFLVLGDWSNVILALQKIKTISSTTLVILLNRVLQKSSTLNTINSSMSDISATSPVPTLARYLRTMVTVPISAPLHRIALHRGLNVEGANAVLAVLVQWFEEDNEIEGSKEGGSAFGKGWEEMMGLPEMATEATKRGAKKKGPGLQLVSWLLSLIIFFSLSIEHGWALNRDIVFLCTAQSTRLFNTSLFSSTLIFPFSSPIFLPTHFSNDSNSAPNP